MEDKTYLREYNPPTEVSKVQDILIDLAEKIPGLLKMSGWHQKQIGSIELTFKTPNFKKPEDKAVTETKFRLAEIREEMLTFGTYDGSTFDETPLSYLEYLHDACGNLQKQLDFYLKHPTIKAERDG